MNTPGASNESLAFSSDLTHKKEEDPLPWIQLCAFLAGLALLIEILWNLTKFGTGLVRRKHKTSAVLSAVFYLSVLICGSVFVSNQALAKIEINLLGFQDKNMTLHTLAGEVAHRTSLELAPKPRFIESFEQTPPDAIIYGPAPAAKEAADRLFPHVLRGHGDFWRPGCDGLRAQVFWGRKGVIRLGHAL